MGAERDQHEAGFARFGGALQVDYICRVLLISLQYAFDDFGISQVAKIMGFANDSAKVFPFVLLFEGVSDHARDSMPNGPKTSSTTGIRISLFQDVQISRA